MPLILLVAALCGCAAQRIRTYSYPNRLKMTVTVSDADTVDQHCRENGAISDLGTSIPIGYFAEQGDGRLKYLINRVPGCWNEALKQLWVTWTQAWEVMLHELCHADGMPRRKCALEYP